MRELINSIFIIIFLVTGILAAAIFLYDGDYKYLMVALNIMVALNMMIYSKLLMVERKLADESERLSNE